MKSTRSSDCIYKTSNQKKEKYDFRTTSVSKRVQSDNSRKRRGPKSTVTHEIPKNLKLALFSQAQISEVENSKFSNALDRPLAMMLNISKLRRWVLFLVVNSEKVNPHFGALNLGAHVNTYFSSYLSVPRVRYAEPMASSGNQCNC